MSKKMERLKKERAEVQNKIRILEKREKEMTEQIRALELQEVMGIMKDHNLSPTQLSKILSQHISGEPQKPAK